VGLRLLVVDDSPNAAAVLQPDLAQRGHEVIIERSADAALRHLTREDVGAVMCDVAMANDDGLALCRKVVALRDELPVIVTAEAPTVAMAVAAIRAGACDFLTKPILPAEWLPTIERAFARSEQRRSVKRADGLATLDFGHGTFLPMEVVERRYVRRVLDALGGNKASAARVLRVDRRTLYRKLDRWSAHAAWEPDAVAAAE
jgi:DNA-binding NtrC family response regulator